MRWNGECFFIQALTQKQKGQISCDTITKMCRKSSLEFTIEAVHLIIMMVSNFLWVLYSRQEMPRHLSACFPAKFASCFIACCSYTPTPHPIICHRYKEDFSASSHRKKLQQTKKLATLSELKKTSFMRLEQVSAKKVLSKLSRWHLKKILRFEQCKDLLNHCTHLRS